ncbi:MAG: T9SS type A sorting domain-containing protein [Bacteroidota bacterium]
MKKVFYPLLFLFTLMAQGALAQNTITITDNDLQGNQSYTWTSDNIYLLDGFVFLEEGGTLCIQPGTVIKAKSTPDASNDLTSALIITRGAKIFAEGTSRRPIIFTSELDDTDDPSDLTPVDRGLWGGLVVLGRGIIGASADERVIEGFPSAETRALFGGNDNTDDSGVLRYISIRHGGREFQPMEEINGLTLGAVGSETTVDHIEVFANLDDGIEWFGGAVSLKYASVSFCGDDGFDWDLGWEGNGQFWFNLQGNDEAGNGGEHDGASPDDATPFSNPTVYNATYIGSGTDAPDNIRNEFALLMRDNTAGTYANSIFTDYKRHALQVEDLDSDVDSYQQLLDGNLNFFNNIWWNFGEGTDLDCGANGILLDNGGNNDCSALISHLANNGNTLDNPQIGSISRTTDGGLNPLPGESAGAFSDLADLPANNDYFDEVDFKGAFGNHNWLRGWTALDEYGVLPTRQTITITDNDLQGNQTYNWTNDNIYLLDGFVFLEGGGRLNIGPGTIIKAKSTPDASNDLTSTLIITRDAQIFAEGTAYEPIIFTSELDDIDLGDASLTPVDRGLWGGLVVLGNGIIGASADERVIEGFPSAETRALFGGNDNSESSGVIRYISIRHGGREFQPMEEINGLTLGAVGAGTTVEYIEVMANLDDGIEWFGGAVDVKYATVSFCGDDGFDWDLGWVGRGQYWFNLQGDDEAGNGGEHDGASPDDAVPFSNPTIFNATYIGSGTDAPDNIRNEFALLMRDNTAGTYGASIFTDYKRHALQVEDLDSDVDSYQQLLDGNLNLQDNIWWNFGEGTELNCGGNGILLDNGGNNDCAALISHLTDNGNQLSNPELGGISRTTDGGLDPRPTNDAVAYNGTSPFADTPEDDYTDQTYYAGAFCDDGVWVKGWTGLSDYNILSVKVPYVAGRCDADGPKLGTSTEDLFTVSNGYVLGQNIPNPAHGITQINFELPQATTINIAVFDVTGRKVAQPLSNERMVAGQHMIELNTTNLADGIYFYTLYNNETVITKKMTINN